MEHGARTDDCVDDRLISVFVMRPRYLALLVEPSALPRGVRWKHRC